MRLIQLLTIYIIFFGPLKATSDKSSANLTTSHANFNAVKIGG